MSELGLAKCYIGQSGGRLLARRKGEAWGARDLSPLETEKFKIFWEVKIY